MNLSVTVVMLIKVIVGVHSNPCYSLLLFKYNSSGTVTIRCNVSVTSYDFNASQGAGLYYY